MPALQASDIKGRLIFNRDTDSIQWRDETDYLALGFDFTTNNFAAQCNVDLAYQSINAGSLVLFAGIPVLPPSGTPTIDLVAGAQSASLAVIPKDAGTPVRTTYNVTIQVWITDAPGGGSTVYQAQQNFSFAYTFEDTDVCMKLEHTINCGNQAIESKDFSNYSTLVYSVLRKHSVAQSELVNRVKFVDINADTLVYNNSIDTVETGIWSHKLVSVVTLRQVDGLEIIKSFETGDNFKVDCDGDFNRLKCCITTLADAYRRLLATNPTEAKIYKETVIDLFAWNALLFIVAQMQGDETMMTVYYEQAKLIGGCDGCMGCDDKPRPIAAPGGQSGSGTGSIIVKSSSGNIVVNVSVLPGQIEYDLDLPAQILQQIQGFKQTEVVSGNPNNVLTVVLDPLLSTATKNVYKVTYTGVIPSEINTFKQIIRITKNSPSTSPYYNVSRGIICKRGLLFFAADSYTLGENVPNGPNDWAIIRLRNIFNIQLFSTGPEFIVHAQLTRQKNLDTGTYGDADNVEVKPFYQDNVTANGNNQGYVVLRFVNPQTGQPYKLNQLDAILGTDTAYVTVTITYTNT